MSSLGAPESESRERPPRGGKDRNAWLARAYPVFFPPLRDYLKRFAAEAAEDLAHDAFLRLWLAPGFERIGSPRRYLFRTAKNLAINWTSRHDRARTETVGEFGPFADEAPSAERQVTAAQELDRLWRQAGGLTERRRTALILHTLYGYSCKEIAEAFGVSVRTVQRELVRLREAPGKDFPERRPRGALRPAEAADPGSLTAPCPAVVAGNR